MPPIVALVVTCGLVAYLFWRDRQKRQNVSPATVIPLIWILIFGSRPVSEWLFILFGVSIPGSPEDGSPIDRNVSLLLIGTGVWILRSRSISLITLLRQNPLFALYIAYGFLSIWWSDFPFVSFKRWFRAIGEPVMALVLLTDERPMSALITTFKRASYVLMPFSMLLIKYFPEIGRRFSPWGGGESGGVAPGKNILGRICLLCGFFLFCHLIATLKEARSPQRRRELATTLIMLWCVWWNLIESASSTSLLAWVVAMAATGLVHYPSINKRHVGLYVVTSVAAIAALDATFGLYEWLLALLGKDISLTGRTDLWQDLFAMNTSFLFGVGYESFWLGPRLEHLWSIHWWQPNQAHNGYLEVYLNTGIIGLSLAVVLMFVTYRRARAELLVGSTRGPVRLGFLLAFALFNWTEAGFRPMGLMLLTFYIAALNYLPIKSRRLVPSSAGVAVTDANGPALPSALRPSPFRWRSAERRTSGPALRRWRWTQ